MGEKSGSLFNMIIVVIVAGILIGALLIFYPAATTKITTGATKFIDEGFTRSTLNFIGALPFIK